jgi:hypothetical protein
MLEEEEEKEYEGHMSRTRRENTSLVDKQMPHCRVRNYIPSIC